MKIDIEQLVRTNIKALKPYASARTEYKGSAQMLLDANENPYETGLNRYPDPLQMTLKKKIAELKAVDESQLFLGNGSDEVIDLLFRIFCQPGKDSVITLPPTYGMYKVSADIADVQVKEVLLTEDLKINVSEVLKHSGENTKLLFICHPNNPTGNAMEIGAIKELIEHFPGIVVVDEAYIDFCPAQSTTSLLAEHSNLVVMQTLSKAWGLAGIRLGIGIAHPEIISYFNKVKPPYNINILTQEKALEMLDQKDSVQIRVQEILSQRSWLIAELNALANVEYIYPSETNFLLVRVNDPIGIYEKLIQQGIIVRNRSKVVRCEGTLRLSIGTPKENQLLIKALKAME